MAVARFDSGEIIAKPGEIIAGALVRQAREHVVHAEEEAALGEIHEQRDEIIAALLKLVVMLFGDVENADMNFRAAGHETSKLLAHEEVGISAQCFGAFDRIVIRERDKIHTATMEQRIKKLRIAITFAAEIPNKGSATGTGVARMNVQVALHGGKNDGETLQKNYKRAKVLKKQPFHSFDTVTEI